MECTTESGNCHSVCTLWCSEWPAEFVHKDSLSPKTELYSDGQHQQLSQTSNLPLLNLWYTHRQDLLYVIFPYTFCGCETGEPESRQFKTNHIVKVRSLQSRPHTGCDWHVHCTYKLQALVCSYGTIQGEKRIIYIDDFYEMHPRFLTGPLTWTLDPPIEKRKISWHTVDFPLIVIWALNKPLAVCLNGTGSIPVK